MRFVFIDEAGTSADEPVTIVAGLTVHADQTVMRAEAAIREVLGAVPMKFRDRFIFHATDVWGNPNYRDDWRYTDRLELLKQMMALPFRLGIPISMGMVRRGNPAPDMYANIGMRAEQADHHEAFTACVGMADRFIRDHANMDEVATVVAEDVPEMRKYLKFIPRMLREINVTLPPGDGMLRPTAEESRLGYIKQRSDLRVTRIRQAIHFAEKHEEPLLQLADACAFGLRRYFSEQTTGVDFIRAMIRNVPLLSDYEGPCSYVTFKPF